MLTLFTPGSSKNCEGLSRRDFIRAGTLSMGGMAMGGMTLPNLLAAREEAARIGKPVTGKSVVFLCLTGGATHIETFDPKMTAPSGFRSMTGEVKTSLPGVTIGGGFSKLAQRAHRMAIVRSYQHGKSSHGSGLYCVMQGNNQMRASLGSMYARVAGTNHPRSGLPNYSVITGQALTEKTQQSKSWTDTFASAGKLGRGFNPFYPNLNVVRDMQIEIARRRLDDRRSLLADLDRLKHKIDSDDSLRDCDRFQQQAFDMILGGAANAFDLSKEDPKVVERYTAAGSNSLGKLMLMARRVVETGAGFVTVASGGWDMHGRLLRAIDSRGPALDHAVSTFIDDLYERGLNEKVLLVITGDFGRTPRINRAGGRDHWGKLCTLALVGGGYKMGQVIGESDAKASYPKGDMIGNEELTATIMHSLIDLPKLRNAPDLPRELKRFISKGTPIKQLL